VRSLSLSFPPSLPPSLFTSLRLSHFVHLSLFSLPLSLSLSLFRTPSIHPSISSPFSPISANVLLCVEHCAEAADARCLYVCMRACVSMLDVVSMCAPLRRSMPAGCGVRSCVSMCAPRAVRCHAKDPMKVRLGISNADPRLCIRQKISRNLTYHHPRLYYLFTISPLLLSPSNTHS
jgi:hypothetical protein